MGLSSTKSSAKSTDKKNSSKNKELIKREDVDGTPFTIVKTEGQYFIAIGLSRITEKTENKKDLLKLIEEKDWTLLMNAVVAVSQHVNKQNN